MCTKFVLLKGLIKYQDALNIMEKRVLEVIRDNSRETFFFLEHEEIYTAGTSTQDYEFPNTNNIPILKTNRGGRITYHGPGQRVIYPVLSLRTKSRKQDIKLYVNSLAKSVIYALKDLGIDAFCRKNMVGVWVQKQNDLAKIASIGIRVKKWVTYHGIAININTNIKNFSGIIVCGSNQTKITSLEELGFNIKMQTFDEIIKKYLKMI